jgi:hypothetical protein
MFPQAGFLSERSFPLDYIVCPPAKISPSLFVFQALYARISSRTI